MQLFAVGGFIRDEILGIPSNDVDFSVVLDEADIVSSGSANPFNVMVQHLTRQGFKIFLETPEYLTVRAQFPDKSVIVPGTNFNFVNPRLTADFVLARKESDYSDGRRPDKVEPGSLMDDLARRDFTMNAIAKDAEGSLIDPFNGKEDISNRIIRAVGDPFERLTEDALRAVRALRFSVTKGFVIDSDLVRVMESTEICDAIVNKISDERIKDELSKAFRFDSRRAGTVLFRDFPRLTQAVFSGTVSLDSTMKQKGRGR